MATTMRVVVSVEDEGKVKCIQINLPLNEHLPEVEQRLKMRKALMLVRRSMLSSLRTAVGHDVLGWECPDLGEVIEALEVGAVPDLGGMVELRYPGYEKALRDESRACDLAEEPK